MNSTEYCPRKKPGVLRNLSSLVVLMHRIYSKTPYHEDASAPEGTQATLRSGHTNPQSLCHAILVSLRVTHSLVNPGPYITLWLYAVADVSTVELMRNVAPGTQFLE